MFDVDRGLLEFITNLIHRFGSIILEDVLADVIPDVLLWIQLWRVSWQEIQCYVGGNNKITAVMITGTIDDEQNMPPAKFLG